MVGAIGIVGVTGRSRVGCGRDVSDLRTRHSGLHACRDHFTGWILWPDHACAWVQLENRSHHGPKRQAISEGGRVRTQAGNPHLYPVLAHGAGTRHELAPEDFGPPTRSVSG